MCIWVVWYSVYFTAIGTDVMTNFFPRKIDIWFYFEIRLGSCQDHLVVCLILYRSVNTLYVWNVYIGEKQKACVCGFVND